MSETCRCGLLLSETELEENPIARSVISSNDRERSFALRNWVVRKAGIEEDCSFVRCGSFCRERVATVACKELHIRPNDADDRAFCGIKRTQCATLVYSPINMAPSSARISEVGIDFCSRVFPVEKNTIVGGRGKEGCSVCH